MAQTGAGKTAAFARSILERFIAERRRPASFTALEYIKAVLAWLLSRPESYRPTPVIGWAAHSAPGSRP